MFKGQVPLQSLSSRVKYPFSLHIQGSSTPAVFIFKGQVPLQSSSSRVKCPFSLHLQESSTPSSFLCSWSRASQVCINKCPTRCNNTWCGRKVMRLATLCTNRQRCCLPLHMAVRLTPAVDLVQV